MRSRFLSLALAVAALTFGVVDTASAQIGNCRQIVLPNGTVLTCDVDANGQKVYTDPAGNVYPATSTGIGQFVVTNSATNPCTAELDVTDINITSFNPVLGTITTRADLTRQATRSKIQSNSVTNQFPASEQINFYAEATLSTRPGRVYRSVQELSLFSGNVNSFNPHVNEVFRLTGRVDFYEINNPGVVEFSLESLEVTLGKKR